MNNYKILLFTLILLFAACNNEETLKQIDLELPSELNTESATDKWIYENLTKPYNVTVVYRWNDAETDLGRNLVPPVEANVIPLLSAIKSVYAETYVKNGGLDFFNTLSPKQLLLIGSYGYNSSGTITLGEAEGGRKITIFGVNHLNEDGRVQRIMKTMHHEFGHIMHQTKEFSPEFQKLSAQYYTSQWNNRTTEEARALGFITNYSSLNQNEDFVEMLSMYVTTPKDEWEYIVNNIIEYGEKRDESGTRVKLDKENPVDIEIARKASETLKIKEAYLRTYLKQNWNIDFDVLRSSVLAEIEKVKEEFKELK